MERAIISHADQKLIKKRDGKLLFNGFWREGNKTNVCAWIDKATWSDIKTGDRGGCKEFARVAFNLPLPEFMRRYGPNTYCYSETKPILPNHGKSIPKNSPHIRICEIWDKLINLDIEYIDHAGFWLSEKRGVKNAKENLGHTYLTLHPSYSTFFPKAEKNFISYRLKLGTDLIAPLRDANSSRVQNLFFRSIDSVPKAEKSRLLPNRGGWSSENKNPRAFGYPHLIFDFQQLVLCEGMVDFFAVSYLLQDNHRVLPIGVANASALLSWAKWLTDKKYTGTTTIIFQLDKDSNGNFSKDAIGQKNAVSALKYLLQNKLSAKLFNWPFFLKNIPSERIDQITDIADVCKLYKLSSLPQLFQNALNNEDLSCAK